MPLIQEDAPHPDSYRPDLPLRSDIYATGARRSHEQAHLDRSMSATIGHLSDALEKTKAENEALATENAALASAAAAAAAKA